MKWREITEISELEELTSESKDKPVLIFKHSTRCSISSVAKTRVETYGSEISTWADLYLLNLIEYRNISNRIAEKFKVNHESPQVLLIENGECIYNESHLAIKPKIIKSYSGF